MHVGSNFLPRLPCAVQAASNGTAEMSAAEKQCVPQFYRMIKVKQRLNDWKSQEGMPGVLLLNLLSPRESSTRAVFCALSVLVFTAVFVHRISVMPRIRDEGPVIQGSVNTLSKSRFLPPRVYTWNGEGRSLIWHDGCLYFPSDQQRLTADSGTCSKATKGICGSWPWSLALQRPQPVPQTKGRSYSMLLSTAR